MMDQYIVESVSTVGGFCDQLYDPEFQHNYTSDVAYEEFPMKAVPDWMTETYDFEANFETDCPESLIADAARLVDDLNATLVPNLAHNKSGLRTVDMICPPSPVPGSPSLTEFPTTPTTPFFQEDDLGDDLDDDDMFEDEKVKPDTKKKQKKQPATTKAAPKKVKGPNSKIPAKAKEKVAAACAHEKTAPPKATPKNQKGINVTPPKASSPAPSNGNVLTEEERKERNKIAAQKYRLKLREQAADAQNRCDELLEEQKVLQMSIAQEREKIREIRDLLVKHGLLAK